MKQVVRALIATTLCLLSATVLSAATFYVPTIEYPTIQSAIAASTDPSDVIVVAAGTQIEDNILVDRPLTIQGGGIGVSFIDASASTATGNVVKIDITSGNVLFDGFTIKTGVNLNGIYAKSASSGSTITISHNRIEGYGPTATDEKNYGLIAGDGSLASLVFTYNEITNCGDNTILLERHVGPTDVSYNTFDRTAGDWSSDAYFNMNYGGADITTLQKVSHNTIDMGAGTTFTNDTRGAGITFTSSFTGVAGGFTNIEITDNTIVNLKPYRRGIGFWNNAPAGTVSGAVGDINAPVVSGNTVTNAPGYTGQFGIRLLGLVTNATVTNNDCDGVDYGFRGQANNGNLPVGAVVNGNSFTNVTYYSDWGGTGTLDASANWWGSNVAATVATKVSGTVDYTPWLDKGDDTSGDPGFQGDFSVLDVGAAGAQTGTIGRIQEAIGLVSGSTINVAAGLYDERITINKTLTLLGATNGVSKKGFAVPALYAYDALTQSIIRPSTDLDRAVVHVSADGVVFDGFVVANQVCAAGSVYRDLVAIDQALSAPTGVQILNNVLGPNTNTASQDGTMGRSGITVYGPHSAGPVKLIVRNNKIFDSKGNGAGIMIVGPYGPTYHGGTSYTSLFSGSVIENNEITGNHRTGIEFAGGVQGGTAPADYFIIRNNLITNNGWFALADKDNLKYGHGIMFIRAGSDRNYADASGSRYMSVEDNEITGNEKSGLYIGPKNKDLFFDGNAVQNNGLGTGGYSLWDGIRVDLAESYYAAGTTYTDYGYLTNIPFANGDISGNGDYGYRVIQTPSLGPVNARPNWWGAQSGPYHASVNPGGTGNDVSDNVLFDPWTGMYGVSVVPAYTLTNCTTPQTVTFHIERTGTTTDQVRGYEVKFSVNTAVATAGTFVEGPYLKSLVPPGGTQFYFMNNGGGVYTVSCAILGGGGGGGAVGDLFSVVLTPVAAGTSAITITSIKVRDLNNAPLAASGTAGSIRVECTPPTMDPITEAQNAWYNAAPVLSHVGFDDDLNLDLAEYNYNGGTWATVFTGIDATSWNSDPWTLPDFGSLSEGSNTIYFRVKDDAGNWNTATYSWQFNKDTEAPAAPTNFVAMPGHDKVHLTWTNPTGDGTFEGVEIRRVAWGGYAHYLAPLPSYPANSGEGSHVVFSIAPAQAYDDTPIALRDIYYYAAFSKDLAGNHSSTLLGASDRSTSYWLGDVTSDGLINVNDLVPFSATFGLNEIHPSFNSLCDFGPTDDWSRLGIPVPDNTIDFEDLMIFSMNWGNVTPAGVSARLASGKPVEELGDLVEFQIVPSGENEVSIVLKNRASTLKGIHLVVEISDGELVRIERGSVFGSSSQLFFGTIPSTAGDADVCISALGVEVPLKSSGEIARLVLKPSSESAATVRIKVLDLRNLDNEKCEVVVTEEVEAPFVPNATALMQNFPNPFNPSTTLAFDVAQAGNVTMQVYDVSGRLVVTLLNAHKEIGRHRVEWNGKNASGSLVPSGIYFYRMRAAGFEVTKKMILVR